ncbi:general substrate transporter [Punctularia strigosozonata HHB-11173 SS5]|uniref:general substrate transporter n=1 Tax=Punctularia strigosozonata (strain HHB-11173) TaxID=741275 RepID=UPI0004416A19|nr:general substrate transporter [Punctularia strigosozonata HHB-11173 SS5]EIN12674.1 general substrate transporter [Punctularia strigosozonata HHB-11173 SS5]
MYLIILVACFCSGDSGFDGTVMGGINSMKQYQTYFDMSSAGAKTSIVFGVYTMCRDYTCLSVSILPDMFGRRVSMFCGNLMIVIGACVTATAKNRATFIGGRYLTGLGSGTAGASAKSFLGELTPPQHRGLFMGLLNSFYFVGQITASGMMVSTGRYNNNWSWRLPIFVQLVPAALNVLLVFTCPESPRWLYSVGRKDEARQILAKLHSQTGNVNSPLIDLEMEEIEEKVALDGSDKRWWDFRPLFRTATDRYRTLLVIIIGTHSFFYRAFGQLSGNGLITYFLPVLLKDAGIKSQNKQLTLNFVNSITSYMGALTGSALVDRIGRRRTLLIGTAGITIILAIVSGLLSETGNAARSNAGVAFIFLFGVVFSFGWTAMQALYPMEVLSYESRAKGLGFLNIITQGSSCINTFGLPVALQKIGWKVYLIFVFWDLFEVIVIYFTVVETKGFTLEEIEEVFKQPNPVKYSTEHRFRFKPTIADDEKES